MNINILKKHIAVGKKRPFHTNDSANDSAAVAKRPRLDLNTLRANLKQLIETKFEKNIGFQGIDSFIDELSEEQCNEFIKALNDDPNCVQSVVSNHKDNFLEWCLRMKIPIVDAVLNWIDPARLALLTAKITENDKDVNGYTFFPPGWEIWKRTRY